MSIFSKILGSGTKEVLNGVGNIIGKFKMSPSEKESFKLQLESLLQKRDSEIEETYRSEINAKADIIKAELSQGDNYTKRARPTVVYMGLVFILLEILGLRHLILSNIYQDATMLQAMIKQSDAIFNSFLLTWGGVVGVYGIGRSFEKTGVRNRLTGIITGSGASKVDDVKG